MTDQSPSSPAATTNEIPDAIDQLAGIKPGSSLDSLRKQRPDPLRFSQGSYLALFEPDAPGGVSRQEREMIALRVAILSTNQSLIAHHRERLVAQDADDQLLAAVELFPDASLSSRQAAILRYVDRLTQEPRAAGQASIQDLQASGLTTPEIVTIAQLIAFLSYQIRVVAGLRALGAAS